MMLLHHSICKKTLLVGFTSHQHIRGHMATFLLFKRRLTSGDFTCITSGTIGISFKQLKQPTFRKLAGKFPHLKIKSKFLAGIVPNSGDRKWF
jgi:hypothetical protein